MALSSLTSIHTCALLYLLSDPMLTTDPAAYQPLYTLTFFSNNIIDAAAAPLKTGTAVSTSMMTTTTTTTMVNHNLLHYVCSEISCVWCRAVSKPNEVIIKSSPLACRVPLIFTNYTFRLFLKKILYWCFLFEINSQVNP